MIVVGAMNNVCDIGMEIVNLNAGELHDPHSFLGLHSCSGGENVIRLWRPGAESLFLEVCGDIVKAVKIDDSGLFEVTVSKDITYADYRVYHNCGLLAHDPYAFTTTVGDVDRHLFARGVHYELYNMLGARIVTHSNIKGTKFAVWAPNARGVALIGDFNNWDGGVNPMRKMGESGIWELFVPEIADGEKYKFALVDAEGEVCIKSDPFAYRGELRPSTASVVSDLDSFSWNDDEWIEWRYGNNGRVQPMIVYELHLGSWMKDGWAFMNYRDIAHVLTDYCLEMGFTHVELMPIMEHPLDESWGYQVSGFYAATSRYGSPQDFQYFVDYLHGNHIGVILDWVPGHFPTDAFSLGKFDGTCLYEHADDQKGYHPQWHTNIFNYGRYEVTNFLIANALFWFDKMHVDGLRVDAVASMLYLDYGRENDDWLPNQYGGKENIEAIEFMKHLNSVVEKRSPGVLMIAEESTSFKGVTHSVERGGLGFTHKWNMGWMNDTLRYFGEDPFFRSYKHDDLTFGLLYAFTEKFSLALSHDEVVHEKRSLLEKMPGDIWQKFANLRLLYSYMICQPGNNLIFMGGEFGVLNEWNCKESLAWELLEQPMHKGMQTLVKDLNYFYRHNTCLWEKDFDSSGFEWIDVNDRKNSVISYRRKGVDCELICVHNFTPMYHPEYIVRLPGCSSVQEVFNSDDLRYGGSGKLNKHVDVVANGFEISMAPLATMIFSVQELV